MNAPSQIDQDRKQRTPRHAVELEKAVLGVFLSYGNTFADNYHAIRATTFFKEDHQLVFEAMAAIHAKSGKVDLYTVTEEMKRRGTLERAGGAYYLVELTNAIASPANLEYHLLILRQYEILREGGKIGAQLIERSREPDTDPVDMLEEMQRSLFGLLEFVGNKRDRNLADIILEENRRIDAALQKTGDITGLSTGFTKLDELTSGLQPGDLTIIAARPSMGKTAFAVTIARNIAVTVGVPVGIFTLEMSSGQLVSRLASMESGIPAHKLRNPKRLTESEKTVLFATMERMADYPLRLDDTAAISIFELRAKARMMKAKHGIGAILVDYLQLMTNPEYKNREQEISSISRGLKSIAKELDVPVIALSQLSRAVEIRGGMKRPQLSDIRESGGIEQDADNVWFLYRPEYYGIEKDENDAPTKGRAEVIVAKHRHGALDTIDLYFNAKHVEFRNPGELNLPEPGEITDTPF